MQAQWQHLIDKFSNQCEWVGIREYRELTDTLSARNGKAEATQSKLSHGAMLEVLHQGQFAYAATVDLTEQGLTSAFTKALEMASCCAPHKLFAFNHQARPANCGQYSTPVIKALDSLSFGEIENKLIQITQHLQEVSRQLVT